MPTPDDAVPIVDALEQSRDVADGELAVDRELPLEADEADAAEQSLVVPFDQDEDPAWALDGEPG